jgi:hypothetical protein
MPVLLVRNVPEGLVRRLKQQAKENRRSLQGELLTVLEAAAREPTLADREAFFRETAEFRERLARSGRTFSDSTELIREDRDR